MGFLSLFQKQNGAKIEKEITELGFEVSECSADCDGCTSKFPSSVKILTEDSLWNSTKPYGMHLFVSTGKSDWPHEALSSHRLASEVSSWASNASGTYKGLGAATDIKVSVSSLTSEKLETDDQYISGQRGDILIFPFFVWVKNVSANEVGSLLSKLTPILIDSRDFNKELPKEIPEFPHIVIEPDVYRSYIFLCSHKTRDKRCGVTAPIMKKELEVHLRDDGLIRDYGDNTPGGVKVAYLNHVGGHKYAANVIIYLKSGKAIWLARCNPKNAGPIVQECILRDGKVWPDKVRLVQKFNPVDW